MVRFLRNIIWAIIIFILCALPSNRFPSSSFINIPHFDKVVHFGIFFIWGIFIFSELNYRFSWSRRKIAVITSTLVAVYGGVIELLQHYCLVSRSGDYFDFLADILGGIVAVGLFAWLKKQKDLLLNRKPFVHFPFLKKIL